jgi:hypothetical protein
MTRFGFFQESEQAAELSDAHPLNLIDQGGEFRVGFIMECRSDDSLHSSRACRTRHGERISPVTGDNRERRRSGQASDCRRRPERLSNLRRYRGSRV